MVRPSIFDGMGSIWRYRELLWGLVLRNLKVKYQRSAIGFLWTLLNPVLTATVLIVVFTNVIKIPLPDYWAFLLSGYFAWNFMQQCLNAATYTLGEHAPLTRSIAFPKEVLIIGTTISRMIEFAIELALVMVILAVAQHHGVPMSYAIVPVLILLQFLLCLGLQLPVAALSVFFRDVQHALPIAIATLFYISPVFYAVTLVPGEAYDVYMLNPIARVLTLYHEALYQGVMPSFDEIGIAFAISLLTFLLSYAVFNRYQHLFAEVQ
jgi:lipopolysaccharide transport system permease protein